MGWEFVLQTILLVIFVVGAVVGTTWAVANKFFRPYKDLLQDTQKVLRGIKNDYEDWIQLLRKKHEDELKELDGRLQREKGGAIEAKDTEKQEMIERIEKQRDEYKQAYESEKDRRTELELKHSTLVKIVAEYDKRYGRDMMSDVPTLGELLIHQPEKLTEMITSKDKGPFPLPPLKRRLIRRKKPPS